MKMLSKLITLSLTITLAACGPSRKEQVAAFNKDCQTAFTAAQCRILATMYGASLDAQDSPSAAMGFAAGSSSAVSIRGR